MLYKAAPYYTMFPLEFPLSYLKGAQPGDWVLDPFCGRGTTLYAARLRGLPASGVDVSPVAAAMAAAQLSTASMGEVLQLLQELLKGKTSEVPAGDFWTLAYHPKTLESLVRLRGGLMGLEGDAASLLRLFLLGRLHGPIRKTPTYLSNQMPRTFAPKPNYAVRFWRERGLLPPQVDPVTVVKRVAERYLSNLPPKVRGKVEQGDARNYDFLTLGGPYRFVITSPPYPGMRTYVPDQWLRNWFLGGSPTVSYYYQGQLGFENPERYVQELRRAWLNVARACHPGATLVVRLGSLPSRRDFDPREMISRSLENTPWRLLDIRPAGTAEKGKRQAVQFGKARKAVVEYDGLARLM